MEACKKIKMVEPVEAYCWKCRVVREMRNSRVVTMKNGRPATQGLCPVCGSNLFRIGKNKA
jgi:Zn finger protein HypA/HybF involved in hydrogenase expression